MGFSCVENLACQAEFCMCPWVNRTLSHVQLRMPNAHAFVCIPIRIGNATTRCNPVELYFYMVAQALHY